jgi:isopenicillin N synthase-like dioxygenase
MKTDATLPLVDIRGSPQEAAGRAATVQAVDQALTRDGFMYVTGHGIDPALIEKSFSAMRWFFAHGRKFKNAYAYTDVDANFGYQGMEAERLDPRSMADLKESFTMRNALEHADHVVEWPEGNFRDIALELYTVGLRAAYKIMQILTTVLGLPPTFFASRHSGENVTLRFLHYPAGLTPRSDAQFGAGAHTDYGSITLLFQDDIGGLELLGTDGRWHAAPPMPGAAIINTGDLMERWTNGRFRSTLHRVRPIGGRRDRYSIALFVDPDSAVEVECFDSCVSAARPLRYPRITAGEHIRQKIAASQKDGK